MIGGAVMSTDDPIAFAEELARIASTGGGPAALAAHLATLLDAAVLVEDAEWRHIALASAGQKARVIPASGRDLIAASRADIDAPTVAFDVPGAVPGIAVRIRGGETHLGWLSVFPVAVLDGTCAAAIRLTAATLAIDLSRDGGGTKHRRATFWDRLIARAYDDPLEAKDDAAARGSALAAQYVAVVVEAEGLEETDATAKLRELRKIALETLRSNAGEATVLERGGGFVVLCPAPLDVDAANIRTAATLLPRAASKARFGATVVGGVGRPTDAIAAYRTIDEAREATFIARRLFGGSRVMPYDELGVYPLILRGGATHREWSTFSDRILAPLRAYDEKHQTELIRTLRRYFALGQNVKTAAADLCVHRHTVVYRLRQIAEIGRHRLDSPHDQLTLRTALAIDALHTNER